MNPARAAKLLLREYSAAECGTDGYPLAWREPDSAYMQRIPDLVRSIAGNRCERCRHPYRTGVSTPEWSGCDRRCLHRGPLRICGEELGEPNSFAAGVLVADGTLGVEAKWRVLTVHHLTGEKADCRWWNLAALCQRCHLTIQGRVRMHQVYGLEHSMWFKPHAAGYYAATYLGQDVSRAEALEREAELLALERVA